MIYNRDFFYELHNGHTETYEATLTEVAVKDKLFMDEFTKSENALSELAAMYKGYLLAKKVYKLE